MIGFETREVERAEVERILDQLQNQHRVAEAVKAILLRDGFLVGFIYKILAGKGTNQHQQG